jgi:hypothetical protein
MYMDVDLLRQMADYHDIPVPREAQVTRTVVDTTDRELGFDKWAKGHADRTATEEVTESYQSELRPVKLCNDVIDELLMSDGVCDLTQDPDSQIIHRHPVLAEGEIELAPASEVGEIVAKFVPLFTTMLAEGRTGSEPTDQELAHQFFYGEHEKSSYVMSLELDDNGNLIYFVLDPGKFYGGSSVEDVCGELSVFGLAERIIREGSTFSLDRYVVPGLNRTLRRAMGKDAIRELMEETVEMRGGAELRADDLNIRGPATVVKVAAVFN